MPPRLSALIVAAFLAGALRAGEEPFGPTTLHTFRLTVSAKDYAAMDPPARPNPFAPAKPVPGRPAPGSPDFGAGSFNHEFPYVKADVAAGDLTLKEIGLRYKGNGTYLTSARQAKRSLKLDFDRHDADQRWLGLKKVNLHSGVMDPSRTREALAYGVFRAAGVPAPRTAFAEVSLAVPNKFDGEFLGLYTMVEQVEAAFLKRHFGNGKGLLLKPEGVRGLPHFGDDATAYAASYNPKDPPADWTPLAELTRLIHKGPEAEFRDKVGGLLDLDNVARFLAANALLASLDGFLGLGHNYYLYLVPSTGKFAFVPWDLDLAFGAFTIFGNAEQLADLSIDHPHLGDNALIDRLMALPPFKAEYRKHLTRLNKEVFASGALARDLEAIDQMAKGPLAREAKAARARNESAGGPGMFAGLPVKAFIDKRSASVAAQLAGGRKGHVPAMAAFGPPPAPMNPLAKPLFDRLDADKDGRASEHEFAEGMKKLFGEWDRDKSGALDAKELAEGLQKLTPARPFGPPASPRP